MVKLYEGAVAINKAINSIKTRSGKLSDDIQTAALSVIAHVEAHSDTSVADNLVNALGKGIRRDSLAQWLVNFGKLRVLDKANPKDAERIKIGHVFGYDGEKVTDMEGAATMKWFDAKRAPEVTDVFDVAEAYKALMKRIDKAQKDGKTVTNPELVERLVRLMA